MISSESFTNRCRESNSSRMNDVFVALRWRRYSLSATSLRFAQCHGTVSEKRCPETFPPFNETPPHEPHHIDEAISVVTEGRATRTRSAPSDTDAVVWASKAEERPQSQTMAISKSPDV